ncbi:MAG: CBS domain-containing protein, partial [Nitrososphaera sp.]
MEHSWNWPDTSLIRKRRKQLGITQENLARLSAVSQPVISRIEDGTISDPSYGTVRRIFEGLRAYESGKSGLGKTHLTRQPTAGDLMNEPVITVKTSDRVKDAWVKMKKHNFSQLPVVDDRGRVAGGIADNSSASEDTDDIME